jgi:hypothetical protein
MKYQSLKIKIHQCYSVNTKFFDCFSILPEIKYNVTEWIICKNFNARHASKFLLQDTQIIHMTHVIMLLHITRKDQVFLKDMSICSQCKQALWAKITSLSVEKTLLLNLWERYWCLYHLHFVWFCYFKADWTFLSQSLRQLKRLERKIDK